MNLKGNAKADEILKGKINGLKTIHGYSAYEVAVINGFDGTEKEWLESLVGASGSPGKQGVSPTAKVTPIPGGYRVTINDAVGESTFILHHGIKAEYDEKTDTLYITGGEGGSGEGDNLELDTTLAVGGAAADAKAVGDAIAELRGEIENIETPEGSGEPGQSMYHYWEGTKLVITSASGTSSANLEGAKGADGATIARINYVAASNKWNFTFVKDGVEDTISVDGPAIPDSYTKTEIDNMFQSYVNDVAGLLGGDA